MVALNFDRARPEVAPEPERGRRAPWLVARERHAPARCRADVHRGDERRGLAEALPALAEASRTVGSPQIRNRGTIGGNLGTASPAGDALPPLLVEGAEVEVASVRGSRRMPLEEFLVGVKRNALAAGRADRRACCVEPSGQPQTFMKVGPRNAMVIAVCSLALVVDRERGEIRAAFGSSAPVDAARDVAARRGRRVPGAGRRRREPDRRRARHGRVSPPRAPRPHRARAREVSRVRIELTVNGERREADVWAGESLLTTLRDRLELPGSKNACEQGECGSCSVLLDGELVCSCLVLAAQADGHEVVTVEGLADGRRSCTRCRRRSPTRAPCSAASARRASSSRGRSPAARARPERRRDPRGALGESLPLHRVPEDPRRRAPGGRSMSTADANAAARPRRDDGAPRATPFRR